jgi:hypothetical protein
MTRLESCAVRAMREALAGVERDVSMCALMRGLEIAESSIGFGGSRSRIDLIRELDRRAHRLQRGDAYHRACAAGIRMGVALLGTCAVDERILGNRMREVLVDDVKYVKTRWGEYTEDTIRIRLGCGHVRPVWADQANLIHRCGHTLDDGSSSEHCGVGRVVGVSKDNQRR